MGGNQRTESLKGEKKGSRQEADYLCWHEKRSTDREMVPPKRTGDREGRGGGIRRKMAVGWVGFREIQEERRRVRSTGST